MDPVSYRTLVAFNREMKKLDDIYRSAAKECGMAECAFWILYTLRVEEKSFTQAELCEFLAEPKQTVNSVVANMVKKEFVKLEPIPGTRNRKLLRLTENGRYYCDTVIRPVFEAEYRTIGRLTEQELDNCISLLGKYISYLKEEAGI